MINKEDMTKLNDLFNEKVFNIQKFEEELRVRKQAIAEKYAEAYIKLVMDVIERETSLNRNQPIAVKNNVIGNYFIEGEEQGILTESCMTKKELNITLRFDPQEKIYSTRTIIREYNYDERMVNEILSNFGIKIQTFPKDGWIKIVFVPKNNEKCTEEKKKTKLKKK